MTSVTKVGSTTTSAFGTSAAASACHADRKPSTAGGPPSASERYGSGAIPIPPPTSSGRSTSRRKPFPSGPRTAISSPASSAHSARVPGPIGSIRNASSPGGARQRLIGRGRTRPGASSMKNCPGIPGSSPPRRTRRSVYGPTASVATTSARSRLDLDALLERERRLAPRVRDRVHRRRRAGERRDARYARGERGLADQVAVAAGAAGALGRVHDEVAAALADQVDDVRLGGLGHLGDALRGEARALEHVGRPVRRQQPEAEPGERGRDRDERGLVAAAHGEER